MGIRQIPTKTFLKYLKHIGLKPERTKGSHTSFNYPIGDAKRLDRPVVVRVSEREIPVLHIHTNLKTLGISHKDFEKWLKSEK